MTKNDHTFKRQRPSEESRQRTSPMGRLSSNLLVGSKPSSTILTTVVLVSSLLLSQTAAFSVRPNAFVARSSSLQATRAASVDSFAVQAVQPKRFTSMKERREAQEALDRQRAPPKDKLVDAKMLELLSEQFLYPTKPKVEPRERPRGRPESVPGAMSYETMLKNRQQAEEQELSTVIPYSTPAEPSVTPTFDPKTQVGTTKRKNTGIRGYTKVEDEITVKTRKKVVKNLPEKKIVPEEEMAKQKLIRERRYRSDKSIDLQKYYRTELLTAKEEYSLGMQIHFIMKCEEVHEGLAAKLVRLPTMEEWALACG